MRFLLVSAEDSNVHIPLEVPREIVATLSSGKPRKRNKVLKTESTTTSREKSQESLPPVVSSTKVSRKKKQSSKPYLTYGSYRNKWNSKSG